MLSETSEAKETMDVKQVCEFLGISRATLMRRVDDGVLTPLPKPAILKRHRKLEFQRSDIERLLNGAQSCQNL